MTRRMGILALFAACGWAATGCGWFDSTVTVPEDGDADVNDAPVDDATDDMQDPPADQADGREDPDLPEAEADPADGEDDLPDEETIPTRTNFAPLDTWGLVTLPNTARWAPSFWDTEVTHDGKPSIRQDGYIDPADSHYCNREVNRNWTGAEPYLTVEAGDHIVFSGWIRTDPATETPEYDYMGARFGVDFSNGTDWDDGVAYDPGGSVPPGSDDPPLELVIENWVPMGTGEWTFRVIDFTVPTGDWSQLSGQIIGMALWFQVWTGYNGGAIIEEMGSAWFSDTELHIYRDGAWL